jgi:hypothetical protein
MQACLAALPKAPKPPLPPGPSPFPRIQEMIDRKIRDAGGDPDAMRQAAYQAAQQHYEEMKRKYDLLVSSCYVLTPPAAPVPSAPPAPSPSPCLAVPLSTTSQPKQ